MNESEKRLCEPGKLSSMDPSPTPKQDSDPPTLSIIGEDLTIAGNVKAEGKINLDGHPE